MSSYFNVKTFRISFVTPDGKQHWEYVQAFSSSEAIRIATQGYPGAGAITWEEVSG